MKLVLSPAFSLLPFSLLPHLLPGPLALVLLGHSAFVLAVLSTCTLMLLSGQLHQLPRVFLQISLLLLCFIYIYFCLFVCFTEVFLSGSDGKKKKKNLSAIQETWVLSLGQEDPLEKGMATHSAILP